MGYRFWVIVAVMTLSIACWANDSTDVAKPAVAKKQIYGGTQVKLDVLSPIITVATNKGRLQHYEIGVNVRLAQRFYPTLELGYAGGTKSQKDTLTYQGHGGFFRVGCDINPLKKHPERRSVMLIGVRAGSGWQQMEPTVTASNLQGKWIADVWGEIAAGVQVDIYKGFNMGWAVRMKFLFTEKAHDYQNIPYYIPGYGYRNSMNWGFDYYLGYSF